MAIAMCLWKVLSGVATEVGREPKKVSKGPRKPREKRFTRKWRSNRVRNCRFPPDRAKFH